MTGIVCKVRLSHDKDNRSRQYPSGKKCAVMVVICFSSMASESDLNQCFAAYDIRMRER